MWAVSQPPTLQEILETERLREEYKKCAQALAACNPAAKIEPSKQRKLIYPLIERMVMIGAPADAAVAKGNDNGRSFRCFCTYILTSLFSSFWNDLLIFGSIVFYYLLTSNLCDVD